MKFSNYNIFIELENDQKLLVNTFSGEMFRIDDKTKNTILSIK